jgi:outer membrane protein TolC
MPQVAGSGTDPILARLSIELPLWFGSNRAAVAGATAQERAARAAREEQENHLVAELLRVQYELRDAKRRLDLYGESLIPQASQSLAVTREAFAAGRSGFLDLIDVQRTLLELQLAAARAAADLEQRRAEIEQLIGEPSLSLPPGGDAR